MRRSALIAVVAVFWSFAAGARPPVSQGPLLVIVDEPINGLRHWTQRSIQPVEWELGRFETHDPQVKERIIGLARSGAPAPKVEPVSFLINPHLFIYEIDGAGRIRGYYESDGCLIAEVGGKNGKVVPPALSAWIAETFPNQRPSRDCNPQTYKLLFELGAIASSSTPEAADDHVFELKSMIAGMTSQEVESIDEYSLDWMGSLLEKKSNFVLAVGMAETLVQIGPRAKYLLPKLRAVAKAWPDDRKGITSSAPVKERLEKAVSDLERATAPNQE